MLFADVQVPLVQVQVSASCASTGAQVPPAVAEAPALVHGSGSGVSAFAQFLRQLSRLRHSRLV